MSADKSKAARIADELEYKGQRGIDPWASELSEAVAELRRLSAAEAALLEAAEMVIAWFDAEEDHGKADFYQRIQMCRDSEAALRAAVARTKEARNG